MADPLGLVFSGQDNTGAAFKAPWTSYDPYQAEVAIGEKRRAIMEEKKKAEEKQKKDAFESVVAKSVKWDPFVDMPNQITSEASNYLTNLYATGQGDKVRPVANQVASYANSTADVINKIATQEQQLINKAALDEKVIRPELQTNIAILRDPTIAPPDLYPEIPLMMEKNMERARELQKTNPWMTDRQVEAHAKLLTSGQLSERLLYIPKEYTYDEWMPNLLKEAEAIFNDNQRQIAVGSGTQKTAELTKEQADRIIERNYDGNIVYAGQMRREFARASDEDKKKYGNDVLTFAKNKYSEPLLKDLDILNRSRNININVSTGETGAPVNQQYAIGARSLPAGKVENGVAETTVDFAEGGFAYGVPGQQGELDNMNIRTYANLDTVDEFGILKPIDSTSPVNFRYQNGVYLPTTIKEFVVNVRGGKKVTVRPGTILTRKTINTIKKYNNGEVLNGVIDWMPWAEGAKTYKSGQKTISKTVFAKWEDVAPLYASYVNYRGKNPVLDLVGERPSISVFDFYGIKEKPKSGGGTSGGSSSGATRTTFNPADF